MDDYFFFNDTATTEIYTLSLHDALPIFCRLLRLLVPPGPRKRPDDDGRLHLEGRRAGSACGGHHDVLAEIKRSEEHTSELQSRLHLVCRLLLEKKKSLLEDNPASGSRVS